MRSSSTTGMRSATRVESSALASRARSATPPRASRWPRRCRGTPRRDGAKCGVPAGLGVGSGHGDRIRFGDGNGCRVAVPPGKGPSLGAGRQQHTRMAGTRRHECDVRTSSGCPRAGHWQGKSGQLRRRARASLAVLYTRSSTEKLR